MSSSSLNAVLIQKFVQETIIESYLEFATLAVLVYDTGQLPHSCFALLYWLGASYLSRQRGAPQLSKGYPCMTLHARRDTSGLENSLRRRLSELTNHRLNATPSSPVYTIWSAALYYSWWPSIMLCWPWKSRYGPILQTILFIIGTVVIHYMRLEADLHI